MTMKRVRFALVLVAAGVVGGRSAAALSGCVGVQVFAAGDANAIFLDGFESGDTSAWQGAGPSFSAASVVDLTLAVELPADTTGDHLVELRVSLPGGFAYQSLALPVSAGAAALAGGRTTRRVPGYPFPLAVARLSPVTRAAGSALQATSSLPVAGTPIVSSSLYGNWEVAAYLDGAEQPCTAPVVFTIRP